MRLPECFVKARMNNGVQRFLTRHGCPPFPKGVNKNHVRGPHSVLGCGSSRFDATGRMGSIVSGGWRLAAGLWP